MKKLAVIILVLFGSIFANTNTIVLNLHSNFLKKVECYVLSNRLRLELMKSGFNVVEMPEIQGPCDTNCVFEIAKSCDACRIIVGRVDRVADVNTVTLTLFDTQNGPKAVEIVSEECKCNMAEMDNFLIPDLAVQLSGKQNGPTYEEHKADVKQQNDVVNKENKKTSTIFLSALAGIVTITIFLVSML